SFGHSIVFCLIIPLSVTRHTVLLGSGFASARADAGGAPAVGSLRRSLSGLRTMRGWLLFRPPIALHGLVAGLPAVAVAGDATTAPVIWHGHGRPRRQLGRIGRKRRAVVASVRAIDRRRS